MSPKKRLIPTFPALEQSAHCDGQLLGGGVLIGVLVINLRSPCLQCRRFTDGAFAPAHNLVSKAALQPRDWLQEAREQDEADWVFSITGIEAPQNKSH